MLSIILTAVLVAVHINVVTSATAVATCDGGYLGFETGFIVAVMPPDVCVVAGLLCITSPTDEVLRMSSCGC